MSLHLVNLSAGQGGHMALRAVRVLRDGAPAPRLPLGLSGGARAPSAERDAQA